MGLSLAYRNFHPQKPSPGALSPGVWRMSTRPFETKKWLKSWGLGQSGRTSAVPREGGCLLDGEAPGALAAGEGVFERARAKQVCRTDSGRREAVTAGRGWDGRGKRAGVGQGRWAALSRCREGTRQGLDTQRVGSGGAGQRASGGGLKPDPSECNDRGAGAVVRGTTAWFGGPKADWSEGSERGSGKICDGGMRRWRDTSGPCTRKRQSGRAR